MPEYPVACTACTKLSTNRIPPGSLTDRSSLAVGGQGELHGVAVAGEVAVGDAVVVVVVVVVVECGVECGVACGVGGLGCELDEPHVVGACFACIHPPVADAAVPVDEFEPRHPQHQPDASPRREYPDSSDANNPDDSRVSLHSANLPTSRGYFA